MKKLLNKRGSVLFLVVVVMALLLVAASATYYVVRNQHISANTHYASEQSYQTAYSVSKAVSDFIDNRIGDIAGGGSALNAKENKLISEMLSLTTGSFLSDIDLKELGMGEAKVTIKKAGATAVPGSDNTAVTFEIETTAEVNGESTRLVMLKEITTGPTEYFNRFLTSTGGRQEDVLIGSHTILSDAFFENDYTVLGVATTKLNDSVYVSGTLHDKGIAYNETNPAAEIVVSENFYSDSVSHGGFYVDKIYVGGDFLCQKPLLDVDEVYVLGDYTDKSVGSTCATKFYIDGDCYIHTQAPNAEYHINGDLYLYNNGSNNGTYYVDGDVYIYIGLGQWIGNPSGVIKKLEYGGERIDTGYEFFESTWKDNVYKKDSPSSFTEDEVAAVNNYITTGTARQSYQEWHAEDYFNTLTDIDEITLDDDTHPNVQHVGEPGGDGKIYTSDYLVTINKNSIIHPALSWGNNGTHYIVIDATSQDIYIKLVPLSGNVFTFTEPATVESWGSYGGGYVNIVVKGPHSVIFILPDGVDFQMDSQSFIGHMDLAMAFTNTTTWDALWAYGKLRTGSNALGSQDNAAATMAGFLNPADEDGVVTLKTSSINGAQNYAHNNIFLVTLSKTNTLKFNAQSTFCGYIYAPNGIMDANDLNGQGLAFAGGLIIGSYNYQCAGAVLSFTTPYAYSYPDGTCAYPNLVGKETDIVKHLISFANAGAGYPGGADLSSGIQGIRNLGYQ